jgi:rare lipoprotein A
VVFLGCSSERKDAQNEQQSQQKETNAPETTHIEFGKASWYGPGLAGNETANGEKFNQNALTAAHPSLPMGTTAEVTNLDNGKEVDVTINDRGPEVKGRAIDLSKGAAKKLEMKKSGTAHVKIVTKRVKHKAQKHKRSNVAAESIR